MAQRIAMKPSLALDMQSPEASSPVDTTALPTVISPALLTPIKAPISMTSKEWVIPPRPKPGRKPATDTPPTKRKAQNRAAQRAFRERRAARVGELEEQLDEQKSDFERSEKELRDRVGDLEMEVQTLQTRCQVLENMLERERAEREKVSRELEEMKRKWTQGSYGGSRGYGYPDVQSASSIQAPRPSAPQPLPISTIVSPPEHNTEEIDLSCGACQPDGQCICAESALASTMGCGKCSIDTPHCECLEETLKSVEEATSGGPEKRPHSPNVSSDSKRQRQLEVMEVDYTAMFSQQKKRGEDTGSTPRSNIYAPTPVQPQQQFGDDGRPREKCGFCDDTTFCVCADTVVTLPPAIGIPQSQTQTPPPSEHDVVPPPMEITATGAVKLPSIQARNMVNNASVKPTISSLCGPSGPGTCAQCLADPKSGLFCRSLAANFERQGLAASGCCGGGGPGGCCKDKNGQNNSSKSSSTSKANSKLVSKPLGLSLSCADAYKTLASHRHFNEATDDIGTWLPLLKAAPRKDVGAVPVARPPIEVEAASIMSVLKGFDVRFGAT